MLSKFAEDTKNALINTIKGTGEIGVALQTAVKDNVIAALKSVCQITTTASLPKDMVKAVIGEK